MFLTKDEIEEIQKDFPNIKLSKVHIDLAQYYDGNFDTDIINRKQVVESLKKTLAGCHNSGPSLENVDEDLKFQTINSFVDGYQ